MIPRVSQQGVSFKGAGLYYLHDKQANTKDRVGYTETLNLPTSDPEKAMKVMAWVASHQREIREVAVAREAEKAGFSYEDFVRENNPYRGRPMEKTVYAYSLSWHPSQDIRPEEMAKAAKQTLSVLGLENHQAVLVQHTDEPHPHMHVIVNKVNPETGLGPKRLNEKTGRNEDALKNDHIKLSIWAERYERETGRILCWNRVENNARRFPKDGSPGEYVKYKGEHASRPDYDWWKANEHLPADKIRSQRLLDQAAERTALQIRETKARASFERRMEKEYLPAAKKLQGQLEAAEKRLKSDRENPTVKAGVLNFAKTKIRQSLRKLSGAARRDKRAVNELNKARQAIQREEKRRRKSFETSVAKRWQKLKDRQFAERKRDQKRIALRDNVKTRKEIRKTKLKAESVKKQGQSKPAKNDKLESPSKRPRKRSRNRLRQRTRSRAPN